MTSVPSEAAGLGDTPTAGISVSFGSLAIASTGATARSASATARTPDAPVVSGINGSALYVAPQAMWFTQLAAMQSNGIQMVRSDAPWQTVEPFAPGFAGPIYNFAQIDAWVSALALNHLRWQPILAFSTSWGNPITNYPAFEGYVRAVASRYGDGGSFWSQNPQLPYLPVQIFELWNEEDGPQWYINPHDYAALYGAVHTAIHAIEPSATVLIGGLGTRPHFDPTQDDPGGYVVQMLRAYPGLKGHIDGIGMHPYGASVSDSLKWIAHFRNALSVFGLGSVPIYLTEFGWPYSAGQESWRADQMRAMASLAASNCGISEVAPYDWINPPPSGGTDFGFVDTGGIDTTLRPAGGAWFGALSQAASRPVATVCKTAKPKKPTKKRKQKHHPRCRHRHCRR